MNKKSNIIVFVIAIIAFCFSLVTFLNVKALKKDMLTAISEHSANSDIAANLADSSQKEDLQYIIYLGTNDKETDIPVFTPEECKKKAEEILARYLNGYTMTDARGGWKNEGVFYKQYTIAIYLSDTTLQKVHEVCDELIKTFRQSSVLLLTNKTQMEFYSGK